MNLSFVSHAVRGLRAAAGLALFCSLAACVGDELSFTAEQAAVGSPDGVCTARSVRVLPQAAVQRAERTGRVMLDGPLGCLAVDDMAADSARFAGTMAAELGGDSTESYRVRSVEADGWGMVHVRVRQLIDELPVAGAELVVHSRANTGEVVAVNGRFAAASELARNPELEGDAALTSALAEAGIAGERHDDPELTYVLDREGAARLAWVQAVSYTSDRGPERDRVFADAITGELVTRHPHHYYVLNRQVYDSQNTQEQGVLVLTEGGSSPDLAVQSAYDFAGDTYNFYATQLGRDSFDGNGSALVASVHFDVNFNNAAWVGEPFNQMIYGDGDGQVFIELSRSRDVVAHELTHAVTEYTANLIYQNESGALNEAMSDILGVSVDTHSRGGVVDAATWLLGEDVFTPGIPGDALRFMNNPTLDGISTDYYPARFRGTDDNGGVHINSGIANLAFSLLVTGGAHPRAGVNSGAGVIPAIEVPAIGIDKASKVFYRALSAYMTPSTTFEEARRATALAARDLYAYPEYAAFHRAWSAVGVPGDHALFSASVAGNAGFTAYAPVQVSFTDQSVGAGSWIWQFGDGGTSAEQNPSYNYSSPGAYQVQLTINGDGSTRTPPLTINAVAKPAVEFSASTVQGSAPLSVEFTNATTGGQVSAYTWDFGDGTQAASDVNPVHVFERPGEYTVRLVAQGGAGPVETVKTAFIKVTEGSSGSAIAGCSVTSDGGAAGSLFALLLVGLFFGLRRRRA